MLVKASILATILVAATVTATQVDFRELYNEMYPVNGIKRDVLGLCQQAEPTFIRAVKADRTSCYDSMPDSVEQAIGWVRTSSLLAELNNKPTAVELAEKLLAQRIKTGAFGIVPQFTGYVVPAPPTRPCPDIARGLVPLPTEADAKSTRSADRLARRVSGNDAAALTALGLAPQGAAQPASTRDQGLPVLPLNGAPGIVPASATSGCRTPA
jgi:hypothetical protein